MVESLHRRAARNWMIEETVDGWEENVGVMDSCGSSSATARWGSTAVGNNHCVTPPRRRRLPDRATPHRRRLPDRAAGD